MLTVSALPKRFFFTFKLNPMNEFDQRKEHLVRAATMLKKQMVEESISEQAYYERVTSGKA